MSRRRKSAKPRRSAQRVVRSAAPQLCDCPECSGADLDPQEFVDGLVAAADLLEVDDPWQAELFGASFIAAGQLVGEGFEQALSDGLVPAVADQTTPESLAMLLALDAVVDVPAAADAAAGLVLAGVPMPVWAGELREPVRAGQCRRFTDADHTASMLLCSFERAGHAFGFLVEVDHTDCDAAGKILFFPAEILEQVVATIQTQASGAGVVLTAEELDPAEFRWQVERALDARAMHDQQDGVPDLDEDPAEDGPGYHPLAVLLRARLRALPQPTRPPAPHGSGHPTIGPDALKMLADLAAQAQQIQAGSRLRRGSGLKLPAKRKKSAGPAPVYQLKVSLCGAKPPIWRRLEVPADTSLADLHDIIQVAFDWHDGHLHVFETEYGEFGVADGELGHRAEAPVTLEQVARGAGERLRYTYDFGDDWQHEIVVEKVLDRQPGPYPRCTGGRRAAPPEDCGGIWGYAELVEVLADPHHPEHEERLEWLGLESAADLQPARFDAAEITRALTGQR